MRKVMSVRVFTPEHRKRLSEAMKGKRKKRKFNDDEVRVIRQRLANGENNGKLAAELGINKRTLWLIKIRKLYGDVT